MKELSKENKEIIQGMLKEITENCSKITYNFSDTEDIEKYCKIVTDHIEKLLPIDVTINGHPATINAIELHEDNEKRTLNGNLTCHLLPSKELGRGMNPAFSLQPQDTKCPEDYIIFKQIVIDKESE